MEQEKAEMYIKNYLTHYDKSIIDKFIIETIYHYLINNVNSYSIEAKMVVSEILEQAFDKHNKNENIKSKNNLMRKLDLNSDELVVLKKLLKEI